MGPSTDRIRSWSRPTRAAVIRSAGAVTLTAATAAPARSSGTATHAMPGSFSWSSIAYPRARARASVSHTWSASTARSRAAGRYVPSPARSVPRKASMARPRAVVTAGMRMPTADHTRIGRSGSTLSRYCTWAPASAPRWTSSPTSPISASRAGCSSSGRLSWPRYRSPRSTAPRPRTSRPVDGSWATKSRYRSAASTRCRVVLWTPRRVARSASAAPPGPAAASSWSTRSARSTASTGEPVRAGSRPVVVMTAG
nr:hypothetical protein DA06_15825 [Georgenia sp. SUBG003]